MRGGRVRNPGKGKREEKTLGRRVARDHHCRGVHHCRQRIGHMGLFRNGTRRERAGNGDSRAAAHPRGIPGRCWGQCQCRWGLVSACVGRRKATRGEFGYQGLKNDASTTRADYRVAGTDWETVPYDRLIMIQTGIEVLIFTHERDYLLPNSGRA